MSLYPPPKELPATVWTDMPSEFRRPGQYPPWGSANKPGHAVDCFLEGPSFDRDGNLYVTDIPYGRIFRISPGRQWTLVAEYDGWPNGLKIHRDGRFFITDYKHGIMQLDPGTGAVTPVLTHRRSESFRGVNDLVFDYEGRMYFTDQGQTGMHDPTGRVYRYNLETEALELLVANAPSPNGLVLNPEQNTLYVAVTRGNGVWRVPILADGGTTKVSIFTALAGGVSGADGMAIDSAGRLFVCDAGNGCAWVFTKWAEPVYRVRSGTGGRSTTNIAFGGPENRHVFITESDTGNILTAEMEVPGQPMYSHT
ncbi:MAG TPA: SMP-30/gluconolactonase/LRE family protein [Hyphomicrobiaceae bacterium]|nr:SMP-30/gluconolactonase/LRE family protein [Hyphomicrobiaceae bacterium]